MRILKTVMKPVFLRSVACFLAALLLCAGCVRPDGDAAGTDTAQTPDGADTGMTQHPPSASRLPLQLALLSSGADKDAQTEQGLALAKLLFDTLMQGEEQEGDVYGCRVCEDTAELSECLRSGSADILLMPASLYLAHEEDGILLAACAWEEDGASRAVRRSLILAGPTEGGRALAKQAEEAGGLTWEELSAVSWCVMGEESGTGYVYPSLFLEETYGKGLDDLPELSLADSYYEVLSALAHEEADVGILPDDQALLEELSVRWSASEFPEDLGREKPFAEETSVIAVTYGPLEEVFVVSKESPLLQTYGEEALREAVLALGTTQEGREALQQYGFTATERAEQELERMRHALERMRP